MLSSNTLGHPAIHARRKRRLTRKAVGAALGLCMVVAALTTWLATRTHIVDCMRTFIVRLNAMLRTGTSWLDLVLPQPESTTSIQNAA